jgi:hypothetical protein
MNPERLSFARATRSSSSKQQGTVVVNSAQLLD